MTTDAIEETSLAGENSLDIEDVTTERRAALDLEPPPVRKRRDDYLNVRLSQEDKDDLREWAYHLGLGRGQLVGQILQRALEPWREYADSHMPNRRVLERKRGQVPRP